MAHVHGTIGSATYLSKELANIQLFFLLMLDAETLILRLWVSKGDFFRT